MSSHNNKPIVGITLDWEPGNKSGGYSESDWYAIRENYAIVVETLGGIPMFIPYCTSVVQQYADLIDALILSGGDCHIDPKLYSEELSPHTDLPIKENRTSFEYNLLKLCMEMDMPIFGICLGAQTINTILGGKLIQNIEHEIPNAINHRPQNKREEVHALNIRKDSILHSIFQKDKIVVNSAHTQSIKTPGKDLIINATCPEDGVHEGIEHTKNTFCIGIQWHPEFINNPEERKLFAHFIQCAKQYKEKKTTKDNLLG